MHSHRRSLFSHPAAGALLALLAGSALTPRCAKAHGFAGARFFPATLTTDDPFVADELSLPTLDTLHTPDNHGTREFDVSIDIAKTIMPYLDIEIGQDENNLFPHQGQNKTGLSNLELGSKYQFYVNATARDDPLARSRRGRGRHGEPAGRARSVYDLLAGIVLRQGLRRPAGWRFVAAAPRTDGQHQRGYSHQRENAHVRQRRPDNGYPRRGCGPQRRGAGNEFRAGIQPYLPSGQRRKHRPGQAFQSDDPAGGGRRHHPRWTAGRVARPWPRSIPA